jgi:hypothetical protein
LDRRFFGVMIGRSTPPARRSRARGFFAFFIAAETYYNSGARLLQFVWRNGDRQWRVFVQEKGTLESARLGLQKPKAQSREMNRKKHSVRRDDTKVPKLTALMRERVFCVISASRPKMAFQSKPESVTLQNTKLQFVVNFPIIWLRVLSDKTIERDFYP